MGAPAAVDESRARLASIARMYYLEEKGQHEIASILGISRSQISRLLTRARDLGIVRISVEEYDPRDRELETQLEERYGLRRAVVVRLHERIERGLAARELREPVRRAVGYFAAPAVSELIGPSTTLGLAGGRTLAELVSHLAPPGGAAPAAGVTVLPLMGNIGPTASDIDAADLSRRVARRFGGACYTLNAPAIAQDRAARDHFLAHEHIRTVRELFASLDVALVGVGSLDESAFIERGIIPDAELEALRAAGAVGEICGRFFDASGRECRSRYRDRVLGIELETLRRGADVIVVTNGARRAPALRAALAGGLVNGLVIDDEGARGLLAA